MSSLGRTTNQPTAPLAGADVPLVGQGTWQMEGRHEARAVEALRRGLDLGLTHIDTAEMYGSGRVEVVVGRAMAGRREEVFLVSKVLPNNASLAGTVAACEASLERLGTDRLDLYLLHWPGHHPLEETFEAFERLVDQGKVRRWGVSNFDVDDLERAMAVAGEGVIACNQVCYHLQERHVERQVIPWCRRHGVPVVGYSPFGSGRFPSPASPGGAALADIARSRGTTPRQVALRFLVREPGLLTIPKAGRVEHVEDNAGAAGVKLEEQDIRRLEQAFPLKVRSWLPVI